MQAYFSEFSQALFASLKASETLLLNFSGEHSDFVRLNQGKIRQAGHIHQQRVDLDLIQGQKQAAASLQLQGNREADLGNARHALQDLRQKIEFLPDDPFINFATQVQNTESLAENTLPDPHAVLENALTLTKDLDLVGIWASGTMTRGFANSLGQFNWHINHNFNFDWSIYHHDDKAVKQNYAGFAWDEDYFQQKIALARETLPILERPAKTIEPGPYRVFLAPSALQELMDLINWGGFGLKSHRTLQTPLLRMITENQTLHPDVCLTENIAEGLTPKFSRAGFIKPDSIPLVCDGRYQQCLVDARSGKEYGETVNCSSETAESLQLNSGELHQDKILQQLDTGIFVSNLWYCNFSDRNACRITGMTRYACLWVENGKPVAPLNVMRFDETLYHILGDKLLGLTVEHEHILDPSSYYERSLSSSRMPGVLVDDFRFTL